MYVIIINDKLPICKDKERGGLVEEKTIIIIIENSMEEFGKIFRSIAA